jgi:tetratricopeptide (TPR) repeat protein
VARGSLYLALGQIDPALADAGDALEVDPDDALAHALRGEALRLSGQPLAAVGAFDRALELDPALGGETFRSRWLAARALGDANRMLALGREYAGAHPADPLRYYYRGWAIARLGNSRAAINVLHDGIEETSEPSALLWFALGHAYTAGHFWPEAATSLEMARALVEAGDGSLSAHSDLYVGDLFAALGQAYVGAGRCAEATTMLDFARGVGAPASQVDPLLEEAHLCGTPAPTVTPCPTATP